MKIYSLVVDFVSSAIERVRVWFAKSLYKNAHETVYEPPSGWKRIRLKPEKTQKKPDPKTFADLLDGLQDTFYTMVIPDTKDSHLSKRDITALYKLGVYVPSPMIEGLTPGDTIPNGVKLPAIASCLMSFKRSDGWESSNGKKWVNPRFVFAIKAPRLPNCVESINGVPYQFGCCYEVFNKDTEKKENLWVTAYIVVKDDGAISIPKEIRIVPHSIVHRRFSNNRPRVQTIHRRQSVNTFLVTPVGDGASEQERRLALASQFRQLLIWWSERDESWSVGVRKNWHRVVFSVNRKHTSAYFVDRDRVVTENGATKKIIHFVREHQRRNGSVVKAHVRGLRTFNWRGFECHVVAPKYSGNIFTDMTLPPVEVPTDADKLKFFDSEQVASKLADLEDNRIRLI